MTYHVSYITETDGEVCLHGATFAFKGFMSWKKKTWLEAFLTEKEQAEDVTILAWSILFGGKEATRQTLANVLTKKQAANLKHRLEETDA